MKEIEATVQLKADLFSFELPVQETEYHSHDRKKIHVCQLSYLLCFKTMGAPSLVRSHVIYAFSLNRLVLEF